MALKNPSVNCFRKFKGLQLTFQVVSGIIGAHDTHDAWKTPRDWPEIADR